MVTLQVEGLNFSYGNGFSLKNISFSVGEGCLCSLLGPNACGKTTLIKCIAGFFPLSSGKVIFNNVNLTAFKQHKIARLLSYVPQVHEASFSYSVTEMVIMGRNPHVGYFSTPNQKDLNVSLNALKALNIEHLKDKPYTELSGGQQKLVLIARALAQDTPVMLLDEPTAHLDFKNKLLVLKSIKRLVNERGLIVLMSLHDPNEVSLMADQLIVIKDGEIISQGATDNVLTPELIKEIYSVKVEMWRSGKRKVFTPSVESMEADAI